MRLSREEVLENYADIFAEMIANQTVAPDFPPLADAEIDRFNARFAKRLRATQNQDQAMSRQARQPVQLRLVSTATPRVTKPKGRMRMVRTRRS